MCVSVTAVNRCLKRVQFITVLYLSGKNETKSIEKMQIVGRCTAYRSYILADSCIVRFYQRQ